MTMPDIYIPFRGAEGESFSTLSLFVFSFTYPSLTDE